MTQAFSCWSLTIEVQVQSQAIAHGILVDRVALRQVFVQVLWFYPVTLVSPMRHTLLSAIHAI
jgi:hypothetical protein